MAVTAFVDLWNLATDHTFKRRVNVACLSAAGMVMASAFALGATANRRRMWARATFMDADSIGTQAMWGVISNSAITTSGPTASDAQIFNAVSAYIPIMASAYSTALLG